MLHVWYFNCIHYYTVSVDHIDTPPAFKFLLRNLAKVLKRREDYSVGAMGCGKSTPVTSDHKEDHRPPPPSLQNGVGNKVSPLIVVNFPEEKSHGDGEDETSTTRLTEEQEEQSPPFQLAHWQDLDSKHTQYVDVCVWSPTTDVLLTASSDKQCYLWTVTGEIGEASASPPPGRPVALDEIVCCADWSSSGSRLVLGESVDYLQLEE